MYEELTERNRIILRETIDNFISIAEPVASRSVSRKGGINLSPATVRNAMAELEEMGFLTHPHTSSGRVPTAKGYRFYLNSILKLKGLSGVEMAAIEKRFAGGMGIDEALQGTSKLLSDLTRQASIVMTPRFKDIVFRHIEFIWMGKGRLLALMVSRTGVVIKKIFDVDEDIASGDLEKMNNYLNSLLKDLTITEVKARIVEEMRKEKALYDELLSRALKLGARFMEDQQEEDLYIEGAANMLGQPEFADIETMKRIFSAFEEKSILLELLDRSVRSKGLNIWMGDESEISEMEGLCLVTYPYGTIDRTLGCIGVLGPTRMDYSRIIPLVEYTADKLNSIIREA